MSVFNSISTSTLIVLLVAGAILGVSAANTELFNPHTSAAEANRMNVETAHQQATYVLEERLATARTEEEIQRIQLERKRLDAQYAHDILALNQALAHDDAAFKTWMAVLSMFGSAMAVALPISWTIWVSSRAVVHIRSAIQKGETRMRSIPPIEKRITTVSAPKPYDPWNSLTYRRNKRIAAQNNERKEREELAARMMQFRDPGQLNKTDYQKLPQVEASSPPRQGRDIQ